MTPTGLSASGQIAGVLLSWTANVPTDNVTEYQLWRAPGLGAGFGLATQVWSGLALNHTDTGLAPDSEWTYFLKACNAVCCSPETAGVDATVSNTAQDIFTISFSVGSAFGDMAVDEWDGNYEIFDVEMPMQVIFPANFSTSPTPGCEVAPAANVTMTFQRISGGVPTTVGTFAIAGGATVGTLTTAGGLAITVPVGQRLRLLRRRCRRHDDCWGVRDAPRQALMALVEIQGFDHQLNATDLIANEPTVEGRGIGQHRRWQARSWFLVGLRAARR